MPIFFPFRSLTLKMSSLARTNRHPPSKGTCVRPSIRVLRLICVDVDGRKQPAEADQVLLVVNVMRVPVGLRALGEWSKQTRHRSLANSSLVQPSS